MIGSIGLTIVALGVLALIVISGARSADILEVQVTDDNDLHLQVVLDTCNADVSVQVEEHDDRIVVAAKHHDWYRFVTGSDDCTDVVPIDLAQPVGNRVITTDSGDNIVTIRP